MNAEAVPEDPLTALFQANIHEFLKSPKVAEKIIDQVATEVHLPPIFVRLPYFWLLVPATKKVQEGISDKAIAALIQKMTKTFDGFLGNRFSKMLLPKLAEHMARENANEEANEELLRRFPAIPNANLLSKEALTQAILALVAEGDDAFRRDTEAQLLALRAAVEQQPALDMTLAPPPSEDDPNRFTFIARKTEFVGRESPLAQLAEFAGGDEPFRWWSVGGDAGVGKSRLALEAMLRLDSTWRAGFLPLDEDHGFRWHEWRPLCPTFITLDDAGLRIREVQAIVQAINMAAKEAKVDWPIRVLLLDRTPDMAQLPGLGQAVIAAHFRPNQFKEPLLLEGLAEADALAVASDVAGTGKAQAAINLLRRADVENRPLFVSFAADALRTGMGEGLNTAFKLTKDFWTRTIEAFWTPLGAGDAEFDVLSVATLTADMPMRTLSDPAWSGLGVPQAGSGLRDRLSRMRTLDETSSNGPRIRALKPSFAGEVFVLDRLQDAKNFGHEPATGLLRAAWRHSPHGVSGFVQRAVSDFPDHPAIQWLLDGGPEAGDVSANEIWGTCLRDCVANRLAVGDQPLGLKTFQRLVKLADEIRTDNILSDAAYTAAAVINHLGMEHYELAIRSMGDVVRVFYKARLDPSPAAPMPPITRHRWETLQIEVKVESLLDKLTGVEPGWPIALGGVFLAAFLFVRKMPGRKLRIQALEPLEEIVRRFVSTIAPGDIALPVYAVLRSQMTNIDVVCRSEKMALLLSELEVRKHTLASFAAAESGDVQMSISEAKEAYELVLSQDMPDDVPAEIRSSLLSVAIQLNDTRHLDEARSLLATLLGGEDAISSRQAISDTLGDEATPELVDQLHRVASGLPMA